MHAYCAVRHFVAVELTCCWVQSELAAKIEENELTHMKACRQTRALLQCMC